jgi:ectoine hydroxylase
MKEFEESGFLFLPSLFTEEEIAVLNAETPGIFAQHRPENVRESGSDAVRTSFGVHMYNAVFARLARHPRLVEPARQIFGEDVYMHQFKVNAKAAFNGDVWQWHQDFGTWHVADKMPEPRAMNIAIFLDEVSELNGPLMFVPGSHKLGVIDADLDDVTTSYPLWTINNDTIRKLADRGGIVVPKGPPGSMIMFDSLLVHGSGSNMSPWDRNTVYLSLCAITNHIQRFNRPAYLALRDFDPIDCLPDDCLLKQYDVALPWKDGTPESALNPQIAA